MNAEELKVGSKIEIDEDLATVDWVGELHIGLIFESGQKVVFAKKALTDRTSARSHSSRETEIPSRESFVLVQSEDETHTMGDKWQIFTQDVSALVLEQFDDLLPKSVVHRGYSATAKPKVPSRPIGADGVLLYLDSAVLLGELNSADLLNPGQNVAENGVGVAIRIEPQAKSHTFVVAFPYIKNATSHRLVLEELHLWSSGAEAQLVTSLNGIEVCFFDTDFLSNRQWYRSEAEYNFNLVGIAYFAKKSTVIETEIKRDKDHYQAMEWLTGEDYTPDNGSMTDKVTMRGMAMFIPPDGWDRDEYQFRGRVEAVSEEVVLGQRAWRLAVTVIRAEEDIAIDVIVTEKAWESDGAPVVGDDVEGALWLQGRMANKT